MDINLNTIMSNELTVILQDSPLAVEKKNIVSDLLAPFMAKAEEWREQVETIVVTDPKQTDKMQLARTGRLQLRSMRLEATKLVKERREAVKQAMADFTYEDKLWLRAGQIIEATFDNLESKLQAKEDFAKNWEIEQAQKRKTERLEKLAEYEGMEIPGLGEMTDDQFNAYLTGVKSAYAEKQKQLREQEEARIKAELHRDRYARLSRYADFIEGLDEMKLGDLSEAEFLAIGVKAKADKEAYDAEQKRLLDEANAKAEAERKHREEADAKAKLEREELEAKIKAEHEALERKQQAEREEVERKQREQESERKRQQAIADAKLKAEQEAKAKAEREAEALRQAEADRLAKIEAENKAREKAEAKALKAPERKRLQAWVESFELTKATGEFSPDLQLVKDEVEAKFNAFKVWALKKVQDEA
jgi:colicin import membrane protein